MANLKNVFESINEAGGGDSPILASYDNPDVQHVEPLDINAPNTNFTVLSVDGALSASKEDEEGVEQCIG